jgi:DNA-binding response OmpR family regulator
MIHKKNMRFILLSSDLMLMSAAQGAADRHGATVAVIGDGGAIAERCAVEPIQLIAIDLRLHGLDIENVVQQVRATAPEAVILAGGPHVQRESLAAAAAAGCDEVVTRGQFEGRLDALVARLAAAR